MAESSFGKALAYHMDNYHVEKDLQDVHDDAKRYRTSHLGHEQEEAIGYLLSASIDFGSLGCSNLLLFFTLVIEDLATFFEL